jgi:hypothetical protein
MVSEIFGVSANLVTVYRVAQKLLIIMNEKKVRIGELS